MFTGLIQEIGRIDALRPRGGGRELTLTAPVVGADCEVGESIAVNGACLTVERAGGAGFVCYAGPETLERTTLGELAPGASVNLERALAVGSRLGGHFVQGHVDCVGVMTEVTEEGESFRLRFEIPPELMRYVAPKGSIAVDGISLTVTVVDQRGFGVAVIPHTWDNTTLAGARGGWRVNVETDILAKYVARLAGAEEADGPARLSEESLTEHGFI